MPDFMASQTFSLNSHKFKSNRGYKIEIKLSPLSLKKISTFGSGESIKLFLSNL